MQQNIDSAKVVQNLKTSWQESKLKQKLIFTFAIIALFRLGAQLPIYGINNSVFQAFASGNNLIGFLDMFSGGALGKVSIFALGIGPFITSSIIMQLLAVVIPSLEKLQKEDGEAGRRKIQQYTRVFAVALALFQSVIFALALYKFEGVILPGVHPVMFFVGFCKHRAAVSGRSLPGGLALLGLFARVAFVFCICEIAKMPIFLACTDSSLSISSSPLVIPIIVAVEIASVTALVLTARYRCSHKRKHQ